MQYEEFRPTYPRKRRKGAKPDFSDLDGKKAPDAETIRNLFQAGDFRYQFVDSSGKRSRILNCSSADERDYLMGEVKNGKTIICEVPAMKKSD